MGGREVTNGSKLGGDAIRPVQQANLAGKNPHPHTDSKEPGGQGQRGKTEIVWIRASGIPLIGKCSFVRLRLGRVNKFCSRFPQPEWLHPIGFPSSRLPEPVACFQAANEDGATHARAAQGRVYRNDLCHSITALDRSCYLLATKGVLCIARPSADACRQACTADQAVPEPASRAPWETHGSRIVPESARKFLTDDSRGFSARPIIIECSLAPVLCAGRARLCVQGFDS